MAAVRAHAWDHTHLDELRRHAVADAEAVDARAGPGGGLPRRRNEASCVSHLAVREEEHGTGRGAENAGHGVVLRCWQGRRRGGPASAGAANEECCAKGGGRKGNAQRLVELRPAEVRLERLQGGQEAAMGPGEW
jgi:hypothetical protein